MHIEITPDYPGEPDILEKSFFLPPDVWNELARALGTVRPENGAHPELFRCNLTASGIKKLVNDGKQYLTDSQNNTLIRMAFVHLQGKKFVIIWPGALGFHLDIQDELERLLPGAQVYNNGSLFPERDASGTEKKFDERRIIEWARIIEAETTSS